MDGPAPRIMVTGATGFLGRWAVADLLTRGHEVHAIAGTSGPPPTDCAGARWHRANLLDPDPLDTIVATIRPTHLLHFAWAVVPGRSYVDPLNFAWVESSLRLIRRFQEAGGLRSVFLGSCAEYDPPEDGVCDEQTTPLVLERAAGGLPYGICKAALGRMTMSFAAQAGLSHAWARLFFQFGPYENPARLVPYVIREVSAGREALCSAGTQVRSFMYSRDVGAACAALLLSSVNGYVNIGSDRAITIADLLQSIGTKLGKPDLIKLGVRPLSPFDPPKLVPATTRLSHDVGWTSSLSLDAAIEATIEWWQGREVAG